MCGIIGYIGPKKVEDILIAGLERLEYRGYDSAGIALKNPKQMAMVKSVGKIANLKEKIKSNKLIDATSGIGHTRWATHGEVNQTNAHPHRVGAITLVHNGIIENADVLKERLITLGYDFSSETDSEVVGAYLDQHYKEEKDMLKVLQNMDRDFIGSYALAIMVDSESDKLYVKKNKSPLIIGLGEEENFIISDINAITDYTKRYIILDDLEYAMITKDKVDIYKYGKKEEKEVFKLDKEATVSNKGDYEHFMLKEIMEEPELLERLYSIYFENNKLSDSIPDISNYEEIHLVGCGSALYAGMIAATLFEEEAKIKAHAYVASEYRYKSNIYNDKTLIILISQSGETADTIAVLEQALERNIDTLGVVNCPNSTIARKSNNVLYIHANEEVAVATTKAYLLQVAVLSMLVLKASKKSDADIEKFINEYKTIPRKIELLLKQNYDNIIDIISKNEDVFFIGRNLDYSISLEGSLKLKEISYIHSEAYQAGELKHGTISLIEQDTPVIAIITDSKLKEKTLSNLVEVKSRGASCILITVEKLNDNQFDNTIVVNDGSKYVVAMLVVPILQILAYEVAKKRGCEIDKPRNLAKSVTVE